VRISSGNARISLGNVRISSGNVRILSFKEFSKECHNQVMPKIQLNIEF
jgi:hypothetical protein